MVRTSTTTDAPKAATAVNRVLAASNSFARRTNGNVSILFGLSALVMFGSAGGALDYARWFSAQNKARSALDSAVLAGGRAVQILGTTNTTAAIAAAESYFNQMRPAALASAVTTFTSIESNTVIRGETRVNVGTPFLSMFGIETLPVHVVAEAVLAAGANAETNIEVSMMLDATGSMSGQKIEDMKLAAKDLVDIVVWDNQGAYTSKIGLAPFAPRVNVGPYAAAVTGLPATKVFSSNTKMLISCVTEREGTAAFTDAAPDAGQFVRAYRSNNDANDANNYSNDGECGNPNASEQVLPLSNNKTALKARIDALTANGTTAGQLGTAWAWYLISPYWNAIWPSASRPEAYSQLTTLGPKGKPRLQKIAILMTDGVYNTYGGHNHGDASSMATTISENTIAICNNMKAAGIKVYTVGFDLGGSELAINTLRTCASREDSDPIDQPSYFYNTSTGSQLRGAFRDIALKIASLRLRA